jgi:polyisoprenoid-binding protein YceI
MARIATKQLRRWISEDRPFLLLDVLGKEAHDELRIPGSRNACVYEMTFVDRVRELAPNPDAAVVVYCSSHRSRASADACDRLEAAGYTAVRRYTGGRAAWQRDGLPMEGTDADREWVPAPSPKLPDGEHALDPAASELRWTGRNVGGRHEGTLRLANGTLVVSRGRPRKGAFEVDMRSIAVGDLQGDMAAMLRAHLESADFFDVANHPAAHLVLREIEPIEDARPGRPSHRVKARLTLRGVTGKLKFPATIARRDGGLSVEAHFDLARPRWGARYGSGRLYHRLGMHLVDDTVSVEARLRFAPSNE